MPGLEILQPLIPPRVYNEINISYLISIHMWLENILAFILVSLFFLPLINKVVRLANRAWDEREYIDEDRFKQVVYITPAITILIFILFYFGVLALLSIIEI